MFIAIMQRDWQDAKRYNRIDQMETGDYIIPESPIFIGDDFAEVVSCVKQYCSINGDYEGDNPYTVFTVSDAAKMVRSRLDMDIESTELD